APLERPDEELRRRAEPEVAQAVQLPLPREAPHDALDPLGMEARPLELVDQLLAEPELVVDLVGVEPLLQTMRKRDELVLRVEDEVPAGTEDAPELAIEGVAAGAVEVADQPDRVDEVEARRRERQLEGVAA